MQHRREPTDWQQITLFLVTLGVVILCALMLAPFLSAITGAAVLAIVTQGPYNWLSARIRNRSACASIALILITLAVIIPGFFLAQDVGEQAFRSMALLPHIDTTHNRVTDYIASRPSLASHIESLSSSIDLDNIARSTASFFGSRLASFLGSTVHLITEIVIMLFLLFFLYRDRDLALAILRRILPLREDETHELLTRIYNTIFASALGRFAIAAVQGLLAGLAFWVLGVPNALLWTFTVMACAMLPAFGAVLVWAPIALYLGATGHWGKATILAIWGGLIVSSIDNFLYPILIGTRIRIHTATILISTLGGIAVLGPTGIILGPVVFALTATLLEIWHNRLNTPANQPTP